MIKINGKPITDCDGMSLTDYLNKEGLKLSYIAVECNGEIISKKDYDSKILTNGDVIEIVNFVGGG